MKNSWLIHHFLENSAEKMPNKTALIHEKVMATYSEINSSANGLARYLSDIGATLGDRVVVMLDNSLEYVVSYYAILKNGSVAVPMNNDIKAETLKSILEEVQPKAIIAPAKCKAKLIDTPFSGREDCKLLFQKKNMQLTTDGGDEIRLDHFMTTNINNICLDLDANLLSSIIFTSGSTGMPKGVMLTHKNIVSNTHSICNYLELTKNDIQMVVLPFFYVMGKSLLNTHFAVGGTIVINNKFAFPAAVISQMIDLKVTGFSGVPSTYAYLLHRSPLSKMKDKLTSLRYCTQAGGHMSKSIKLALKEALPGNTKIYIMYGATEASARLTYLHPKYFNEKIDSIGKPIPGVKIHVIKDGNKDAGQGEKGEIVASGDNIMLGYWGDNKATESALDHIGYHTGDIGYIDDDGFIYLVGRKDNLIKVGGHRLNPTEIEDVIMASKLVIEVIVLGVLDELLGNKLIVIAVAKQPTVESLEIMQFCSQKLPKFKVPHEVVLVRSLPKKKSGKIDKEKCMSIYVKNNTSGGD